MRWMVGILALWPQQGVAEAAWRFAWEGANGFAMTGAMAYVETERNASLVREWDVTCFVIEGTRNGAPVGRWALGMKGPETSWRLFFLPEKGAFVHDGLGVTMPQAWNMNGAGNNCGEGGFGFNIGNLGQDMCLDNRPQWDSQIAPRTPFPAQRDDSVSFPSDACLGPVLLSAR